MKQMNRVKQVLGIALAALMALATFTGCGAAASDASSKGEGQDLLAQIKAKGKIVVGMNAEFAPYEFHAIVDGKDTVSGFDVELAKAIASDLGVELEIKEMEFEGLISALNAGQCDVLISGLATTEKRRQQVDFSDPYYTGKNLLLMNKKNTAGMDSVAELADNKIGIQMSSTQQVYAQNNLEPQGTQVTYIGSMNTLLMSLKAGQIDGIVTDDTVCRTMVISNPDLVINQNCTFPSENPGEDSTAVAIPKGESSLTAEINKTIARLKADGQMEKLVDEACALAAQNADSEE